MQDNTDRTSTETQPPVVAHTVTKQFDNKKLIVGIAAGLGILLLLLIALVAALLNKKTDTQDAATTTQSSTASDQNGGSNAGASSSATSSKKVIMTLATKNPKLEYVIYEPKQNANNTTLFFGVRNICSGCEDGASVSEVTASFDSKNSYLLDESAGKKYGTITDQDGKALATPSCYGWIKYQEVRECFVAFAKVPSGTTVSWVFGSTRIDSIAIK